MNRLAIDKFKTWLTLDNVRFYFPFITFFLFVLFLGSEAKASPHVVGGARFQRDICSIGLKARVDSGSAVTAVSGRGDSSHFLPVIDSPTLKFLTSISRVFHFETGATGFLARYFIIKAGLSPPLLS